MVELIFTTDLPDVHKVKSQLKTTSARAFTLIEVMMVILIIAVISGLVVPMFSATDATRLRAAAGRLAADLDFARVQSITHSDNPCVFVADSDNNSRYYLAMAGSTGTPVTNPVGGLNYEVIYGSGNASSLVGVTISSYDFNGDNLLPFQTYGNLDQATDATITLTSGTYSVQITIDADNGEVSVGQIF